MLSHSYLAIRHLLREIEKKRESGLQNRTAPIWLTNFVDRVSDLFEPFRGVARVGYEWAVSESGWEVSLFLGENEFVGGAEDGRMVPINFQFDLTGLSRAFDNVEKAYWNAFPNPHANIEGFSESTLLTVTGRVGTEPVMLQVHAAPPREVGPAMKCYPNGQLEIV